MRKRILIETHRVLFTLLVFMLFCCSTLLFGQDAYEDDDTTQSARAVVVNLLGQPQHNFHDYGDKDWAYFFAVAPYPYTIQTRDLATTCDTVIYFYKDGLSSLPLVRDDWGSGETETIYWQCLTSGTVYLRVEHYDPGIFDEGTSYTLRITADIGANNGIATALNHTSIQIPWDPDNVPANTIGFNVYRSTSGSNGSYVQINSYLLTNFDYIDEHLQPLTPYWYYVGAVNSSFQVSQYTSYLSATTLSSEDRFGPTVISEPEYTQGLSNTIYWDPVPEANEYYLEYGDYCEMNDKTVLGNSGWISANSCTVSPLEHGKRYYYRVRWRDASDPNNPSHWSIVVYSVQNGLTGVTKWNLYY